jgi:hypothetical protein
MHSNHRTEHLKKAASGGFASIKPENYFRRQSNHSCDWTKKAH